MKTLLKITGAVMLLLGLLQSTRYLFNYNALTVYGKGYVWGSVILTATGTLLICMGLTKKKAIR